MIWSCSLSFPWGPEWLRSGVARVRRQCLLRGVATRSRVWSSVRTWPRSARRNVAGFPNVEVINSNFETWEAERCDFDAVVSFSAFHWIAPDLRYRKAAGLLRERGNLVVVSVAHVLAADGDPFFIEVQKDYEAVVPDDPNLNAGVAGPPQPDEVGDLSDRVLCGEIEASGRFRNIGARRYLWDVVYSADEYIAVLNTYSGHRALDDDTRARLHTRIHRRILARPERNVRTTYLAMLYVAERVELPTADPVTTTAW